MSKRRTLIFISVFILISLFLNFCTLFPAAEQDLALSASSAALYEPENKVFLYSKHAGCRLPMASTTKIMTALIAVEQMSLDEQIAVDERAVGIEGSSAYLKAGEVFTLRELLYALMLQSANDAAEAIAYAIGGDIEGFAELMNRKAEALGLENTHFTNPHGLDAPEHYTTAEDLAIIAACALEYPEFCEIVSTKIKSVDKNGISRHFVNHNKLLSRYDGCIGVKTGFTKKSGRCLVSAAERDGVRLISVTIDAPNDWSDHEKLLDYGFDTAKRITLLSADSFDTSLPVLNTDKERIKLGIAEDISAVALNGDRIKYEIQLPRFLSAPISVGDKVGKIEVTKNGNIISTHDILATENASIKKKKGLFSIFE